MFRKLLIANRGEIACRIARTARRLGVSTVAVYSEADERSPHAAACDETVFIGPPAPAESYLRVDKIVEAARMVGADAIHPGYGFLSENASFADALDDAGIIFVGPTADTIRKMGSKSAAKDLMAAADVPITPGYQGADQSVSTFREEATRIGYPVLLKATAGGGGKGMRVVEGPEQLEDALASAKREAMSSFGDDRFLVEKYLPRARHLEVQVFGDGAGDVVHMFERDCSVQRRHQKVIEEAPAPNLPGDVRDRLLEAGLNAARAVDYRGAGTVEFLYDGQDAVYFMEMNTRLQVEHPVSEEITGLDFVEWQLRIAAGEGLPLSQEEIRACGAAVEARLYAENPYREFAPSTGALTTLRLPANLRIDSGVREGGDVTPHYDPMIAKVIARGSSRAEAIGALAAGLGRTRVAGLETNAAFLRDVLDDDDFRSGDFTTRFIDERRDALLGAKETPALARALAALHISQTASRTGAENGVPGNRRFEGFRLNASPERLVWFAEDNQPILARIRGDGPEFEISFETGAAAADRRAQKIPSDAPAATSLRASPIEVDADGRGAWEVVIDGVGRMAFAAPSRESVRIWIDAASFDFTLINPLTPDGDGASVAGSLAAPMPGVVTALTASPGDHVAAGAPLLTMEAMKMEHTLKAPSAGTLKGYRCAPGDQVADGDQLIDFEPDE